jgi:hypothetical protein
MAPDLLLFRIAGFSNAELLDAITDTQTVLAEPLTESERERELDLLRAMVADCRRRGIAL